VLAAARVSVRSPQVVGVAVSTVKSGQNLNFAVPVSYLSAVLANAREVFPLDPKVGKGASVISSIGGPIIDAVQVTHRAMLCPPFDTRVLRFSILNTLSRTVDNVALLFIYRDPSGSPVDFEQKTYDVEIPAGLGKRPGPPNWPRVPSDLARANLGERMGRECDEYFEFTKEDELNKFIEIRVLGFHIVDQ
jgi:hypothetical protein